MSLNPSCNHVDGVSLPILGDQPFSAEDVEVAKAEILTAFPEAVFDIQEETRRVFRKGTKGYEQSIQGAYQPYEGEESDIDTVTVYRIESKILGWNFYRKWYFWGCSTTTRPVAKETAYEFNKVFGTRVRVDGFSGGRDVTGDVYNYNVDTMDGLIALVSLLRRIEPK